MNDNELYERCLEIVDAGMGFDAIVCISRVMKGRERAHEIERNEALNSLETIRKINNGKDEAIDALCDPANI